MKMVETVTTNAVKTNSEDGGEGTMKAAKTAMMTRVETATMNTLSCWQRPPNEVNGEGNHEDSRDSEEDVGDDDNGGSQDGDDEDVGDGDDEGSQDSDNDDTGDDDNECSRDGDDEDNWNSDDENSGDGDDGDGGHVDVEGKWKQ